MVTKKKLLIYAHYYTPDVAATGQILQEMAEGLLDTFDITVICTVPSYTGVIDNYYKENKLFIENINGVRVIRVPVPEFKKKSKISRIRNLISYYVNAKKATKIAGEHEYVMAVSQPPIIGGLLGLYGKKKLSSKNNDVKFIYQIQDFNPEQIEAVGYFKNKFIIEFLRSIDKNTCKKSNLVVTEGRDLVKTLKKRFNYENVPKHVMICNWIDDKKVYPLSNCDDNITEFRKKYNLDNKFVIMYSGNIGLYYDLEGIIKVIEKFKGARTEKGDEVSFAFIGAGSILNKLVKYKEDNNINNVIFIPYQDKEKLIYSLNCADVHFCVNAKGIKGVSVPSKLYGIMAVAKPVLGIMENGSEGMLVVNDAKCGIVCEPADYISIENNIRFMIDNANSDKLLNMGQNGRQYLEKHLSMKSSIEKYKDAILNL